MSQQQQLKNGISINNCISNNISLNGRKINNQIQTLVNTNKIKPLNIMSHNNESPVLVLINDSRSINHTVNTLNIKRRRASSHLPLRNQRDKYKNDDKIHKKQQLEYNIQIQKQYSCQKIHKNHHSNLVISQTLKNKQQKKNEFCLINTLKCFPSSNKKLINKTDTIINRSKSTIIKKINKIKSIEKQNIKKKKTSQKIKQQLNTNSYKNIKKNKIKSINKFKNKSNKLDHYKQQQKQLDKFKQISTKVISTRQRNLSNKNQCLQKNKKKKIKKISTVNIVFIQNQNQRQIIKNEFKHRFLELQNLCSKIDYDDHSKQLQPMISNNQIIQPNNNNQQMYQDQQFESNNKTEQIDLQSEQYNNILFSKENNCIENLDTKKDQQADSNNVNIQQQDNKQVKEQESKFDNFILRRKLNIQNNPQLMDILNSDKQQIDIEISERKKQIEDLKKFQISSNQMMQRLKNKQMHQNIINNSTTTNTHNQNKQRIFDQKYPLKSPKSNQLQINHLLNMKQKSIRQRHDKISQLLQKLYQHNILSPTSHQLQKVFLKKRQQQDQNNLKLFKKQVQHLKEMMEGIKNDKKQIQNINQFIQQKNWSQASKFINKQEITIHYNIFNQQSKSENQNQYIPTISDSHSLKQGSTIKKSIKINEQERQQQFINFVPSDQDCEPQQSSQILRQRFQKMSSQQTDYKLVNQILNIQLVQSQNDVNIAPQSQILQQLTVKAQFQKEINQGFQSNLYFVKQYCIALCQFVKLDHEKVKNFINAISIPLKFNLQNLLKNYRVYITSLLCTYQNEFRSGFQYLYLQRNCQNTPISIRALQEFNSSYQNLKSNKIPNCTKLDKNLQKIFIQSIFQALNESFNYQRPGSIYGQPLPWLNSSKHLKNKKNKFNQKSKILKQNQIDQIFGGAIARVIQWGSFICGFIPDTLDLKDTQIDDQYVIHLRETRMSLLLQRMLIEQQKKINQTQIYQTQVLLNLGQRIFQDIIDQMLRQMRNISLKTCLTT